jgi:hypothetical protein
MHGSRALAKQTKQLTHLFLLFVETRSRPDHFRRHRPKKTELYKFASLFVYNSVNCKVHYFYERVAFLQECLFHLEKGGCVIFQWFGCFFLFYSVQFGLNFAISRF